MSFFKPTFRHPEAPKNSLGLTSRAYEGGISTLCAGCGHDSISAAIIQAVWGLNIEPHRVAKMSGIGCSSKSPNYFLNKAHGFNSVHGRMPSVTTGANVANRELLYIGVSGDGDTASIGMGQFAHVIRRNLNMSYIVENNGCYGLTKGQDSATADEGSKSKKGTINPFEAIDLVALALELGATFVARSFSGDKQQLVPLLKAAMSHKGFALIDVISPCVTFNNHAGSTKSYDYTREHVQAGAVVDFVPHAQEITLDQIKGSTQQVELHNGDSVRLSKLDDDYDPTNRQHAIQVLHEHKANDKLLTGLIYLEPESENFHEMLNVPDTPLNKLEQSVLCPGASILDEINEGLR
ncbi:2-oxoacid:ferredoxin oxidoreductase subunit beta [Arenicella xantha]|uniref:2-oxoglutarate ferredoxin oxidoreductase subunit beta n=1 Tax=Arenicella xantha TaxID=644221 RepID=A0A395JQL6_9GAMM|nr:2-oxoacid:ferredoxin oxidoreductase subunit beta [Arenicella xantha]RBP52736.1 2-oxoglutarate ferredoxin oxidoreductase subunit beta [Arenicella xantha]